MKPVNKISFSLFISLASLFLLGPVPVHQYSTGCYRPHTSRLMRQCCCHGNCPESSSTYSCGVCGCGVFDVVRRVCGIVQLVVPRAFTRSLLLRLWAHTSHNASCWTTSEKKNDYLERASALWTNLPESCCQAVACVPACFWRVL